MRSRTLGQVVLLASCLVGSAACGGTASATALLPPAPSSATAAATSSTTVHLTWVSTATDPTGFKVERSTSGTSGFTQIGVAQGNASAHDDSGLTPGTTYYYRVRATNASGDSDYSNVASAQTLPAVTTPPAAPSNAAASATSSSAVRVTWTDNSSNEDGFQVQRGSSAAGPFAQVGTTGPGAATYDDGGLAAATTYYYRVRATNTAGTSGWSNVASATTQGSTPPPTNVAAALAVLANKAVFFDHASVGMNVMAGVERLLTSAAGAHPTRVDLGQGSINPAPLVNGAWMDHYFIADNGYPLQKMQEFRNADLGGTGLGTKLNALNGIAFMKLCFADFDSPGLMTASAVDGAFATFQTTMSQLQTAYPNVKFVYFTAALRGGGNGLRERYNDLVRTNYGGTGRVFDLASVESNGATDASGRILSPSYNDGTDHLNTAGQDAVARALVLFLAGL
jgi:hypothetical protein